MKFMAIIPARYASTRFPGKPLAVLGGKTVIQKVYEQVSSILDEVYVATDDKRIYDCVTAFGGRAVMTREDHKSGTDRIEEAVEKIGSEADVIINVQGDEPFIQPSQISTLMDLFDNPDLDINGIFSDLSVQDLIFAMCRGGWPESLNKKTKKQQLKIARSYLDILTQVDVSSIDGVKRNPDKVKALLKSYSRNISSFARNTTIIGDIHEHH
jgi:CMP-N-acetylneuraminic acid synthetase